MMEPLLDADDLDDLRAVAREAMQDSCTLSRPVLLDDGAGGAYPAPSGPRRIGPISCGFTAVDGDEAADDVVAVRGRYRLKLPITIIDPDTNAAFIPVETDAVEFGGKTYQVVWAPPLTALSTERTLGMKDS